MLPSQAVSHKVLELFSGIGGMHYAFKYSELAGEIVAAVDINTVANSVYLYNFPRTKILNNNIQNLNTKDISELEANMILMSPPCQPFTRLGNQKDVNDKRSDALKHICNILPQCRNIEYILMENVKGFENSKARETFLQSLTNSGFYYRELLLSPLQFGVPNQRLRYYLLARKNSDFSWKSNLYSGEIPMKDMHQFSNFTVRDIIAHDEESKELTLVENILRKYVWLLDIRTPEALNTNCFTKAYTRYSEGTGSIYTPLSTSSVTRILEAAKNTDIESSKYIETLLSLQLRYFSPSEISRLMCFPTDFHFPPQTTLRQKYRLLGNSINVFVVGELIKLLCSTT